ncbi:MAG: tRNA lysidine(34) synthetase TilS [Rickettsiaceae bacterium]|nr:tRNA lysidine(34) synthetase TilS [Rickettsiaceae bacterium]
MSEKVFKNFCTELSRYPDLLNESKIVICLSGGSDSLALLLLIQEWIIYNKQISKPSAIDAIEFKLSLSQTKIIAVSVDHKLREDSTSQLQELSVFCKKIKIEHHILDWNHPKITSAIQSKARNARYNLITKWCKENGCNIALTGHILEDQLEQVLISLAHGSGIYSYLIPELNIISDIKFIRPLLNLTKKDLQEYLTEKKVTWWEDSSNSQPKYLRNRIRPIALKLLELSDIKRIATSFENIKRISSSLKQLSQDLLNQCFSLEILGYGILDLQSFKSYTKENRFSILRYIFQAVGRRDKDIRLESLAIIDDAIFYAKTKTLLGCKIAYSNNDKDFKAYIFREFGKNDYPQDLFEDGIWDNRFVITNFNSYVVKKIDKNIIENLIKNRPDILDFNNQMPRNIKKFILFSMPGIFSLEKLEAIPHIYNCQPVSSEIEFDCKFIM